jgi:hypothetical protein
LGLLSCVAAAAGHQTSVSTDCYHAKVKPRAIVLACADGLTSLSNLAWSQWNSNIARASGLFDVRSCNPDCAAGSTRQYRVNVQLTRPRLCAATRDEQFSRAQVTFTHSVPSGFTRHSTFETTCDARLF